jgi:hypothetical protein
MKKTLIVVAFMLLSVACYAQGDVYGTVVAGATFVKGGSAQFSAGAGFNVPLKTDTAKGFRNYAQTLYFYQHEGALDNPEVQSVQIWNVTQKYILHKSIDWFVSLGAGYSQQILEGSDVSAGGYKVETGVEVKGSLGVSLGFTHLPNHEFVYFGIDLMPF